MPRITIDTTEARSFELAEPGPYPMTVHKIEGPHKGDKARYIEVHYAFQDPAMDKKCGTVRRNYPIEGAGAGFSREFWKAATGEDIPIGGTFDVDTDDAVGRPVLVTIGHREYQNRFFNEAEKVTQFT